MIELIQIPYSPYCIAIRRLLEAGGVRFKTVNIPGTDRSLVWRLTRQRYYAVPVLKDGANVLFETDEQSQVLAKYIDSKFQLGLFPKEWEGVQSLLWRYFESDIEGVAFKLNDVYYRQNIPAREYLNFIRHKERKFGSGCLEHWRQQQPVMVERLAQLLVPCEQMLATRPFLLGDRPLFVDFDLYGMLANFLYSGHYNLPEPHDRLRDWYSRVAKLSLASAAEPAPKSAAKSPKKA